MLNGRLADLDRQVSRPRRFHGSALLHEGPLFGCQSTVNVYSPVAFSSKELGEIR